MHIGQCGVALLLLERGVDVGPPAFRQLLEGTDIEISVVKKRFELGHVFDEKAPVLPDGIAAHGRAVCGNILLQEINQLALRLLFCHGRCLDLGNQTTLSVCALVPCIHPV